MLRYTHGSSDSIDTDIYYVFDVMPDFKFCQWFCSSDINENRNIITVDNGIVSDCFKGTPDEINNGLLVIYGLHPQSDKLIVKEWVERDILWKDLRVLRGLLSYVTRTNYRQDVKDALKDGFTSRLNCLKSIDFDILNGDLGKNYTKEDILKTFAFQLGQVLALHHPNSWELYTKRSISNFYPELGKYLKREKDCGLDNLKDYIQQSIDILSEYQVVECGNAITTFIDFDRTFNIRKEVEIFE